MVRGNAIHRHLCGWRCHPRRDVLWSESIGDERAKDTIAFLVDECPVENARKFSFVNPIAMPLECLFDWNQTVRIRNDLAVDLPPDNYCLREKWFHSLSVSSKREDLFGNTDNVMVPISRYKNRFRTGKRLQHRR